MKQVGGGKCFACSQTKHLAQTFSKLLLGGGSVGGGAATTIARRKGGHGN
jgi:hypothetical protein